MVFHLVVLASIYHGESSSPFYPFQMNAFLVRKSLLTICVRLNASSDSLISRLIVLIVFMGEHEGGSRWAMEVHADHTCGISCPWELQEGFSGHPNKGNSLKSLSIII